MWEVALCNRDIGSIMRTTQCESDTSTWLALVLWIHDLQPRKGQRTSGITTYQAENWVLLNCLSTLVQSGLSKWCIGYLTCISVKISAVLRTRMFSKPSISFGKSPLIPSETTRKKKNLSPLSQRLCSPVCLTVRAYSPSWMWFLLENWFPWPSGMTPWLSTRSWWRSCDSGSLPILISSRSEAVWFCFE